MALNQPAPIIIAPEEDDHVVPQSAQLGMFHRNYASKISELSYKMEGPSKLTHHSHHIPPPTWKPYEEFPRPKVFSQSPSYLQPSPYPIQNNNYTRMDGRGYQSPTYSSSYRMPLYDQHQIPMENRLSSYSDYLRSFQPQFSPRNSFKDTGREGYPHHHINTHARENTDISPPAFGLQNSKNASTFGLQSKTYSHQPLNATPIPNMRLHSPGMTTRIGHPSMHAPLQHSLHTNIPRQFQLQDRVQSSLQHSNNVVTDPFGRHVSQLQASGIQPNPVIRWADIDGVKVPCVTRNEAIYVSVRIVEVIFLSQFPDSYPQEIKEQPPLKSTPVTANEAILLDAMNKECNYEYGAESFEKDLIVHLDEFKLFYDLVKRCFAKYKTVKQKSNPGQASSGPVVERIIQRGKSYAHNVCGGWMQINNTVIPFITRVTERYIPICVIKYAAGLSLDEHRVSEFPRDKECKYLNETCKSAGLNFSFDSNSLIAALSKVVQASDKTLVIKDLPSENPFVHAAYDPVFESDDYLNNPPNSSLKQNIPNDAQRRSSLTSQQQIVIEPRTSINNAAMPKENGNWAFPNTSNVISSRATYVQPVQNTLSSVNTFTPTHAKIGTAAANSTTFLSHLHNMSSKISKHMNSPNMVQGKDISQKTLSLTRHQTDQSSGPQTEQVKQLRIEKIVKNLNTDKVCKMKSKCSESLDDNELADVETICSQARDNCTMLIKLLSVNGDKKSKQNSTSVCKNKNNSRLPGDQNVNSNSTSPRSIAASSPVGKITSVKIEKKTISVIQRIDGKNYALVEALSRVLFPQLALAEFVNAVEQVLHIDIVHCTSAEEKEFIQFYDLPTVSLKCNKMVQIDVFKEFLAPLTYMFKTNANVSNTTINESIDTSEILTASELGSINKSRGKRNYESVQKLKRNIECTKKLKICLIDVVKENICHDICQLYGVKYRA